MPTMPLAVLQFCVLSGITITPLAAERPNILLIFTDDQGYGDVSAYQASDVRTPNMDRIGTEGMLFTTMRANCTVCSPSRAALLTGQHQDLVGVPGVIRSQPENSWGYFKPGVRTIADELKKVDCHTAIIGKWHLGLESPNLPNERGFDHFHGFLGDMMDRFTTHLRHGNNYMRLNAGVIEPKGHATDLFSDWACGYLRERAKTNQPFFLYLAYNAPHFPIEPPEKWLAKVKARAPQLDEKRAKNVAFIEHIDFNIGRVLTVLKESGLEQNTLVVFSADNGGSLPHAQNNDPWRGGKQDRYEGGSQYDGKSYEAIIRGDWQLMQNDPLSPQELYNLKSDPQEQPNLAATNKKIVNELGAALRKHIQRGGAVPWQAPR